MSISTASTAASIPRDQRAAIAPAPAGPPQARARHLDRRDQPDARRRPHRRRFRPRPPPALRPRGRDSPGWSPSAPARRRSRSAPAAPARQGPGVVYRLWEEAATAGLPRFDPPEILEADLSALLLDCAIWGVTDPRELRWLDPPPAAAIDEARTRLAVLGALDEDGRPTAHGRADRAICRCRRASPICWSRPGRGAGARLRPRSRCCCPSAAWAAATPISSCGCGAGAARQGTRAEAARGLAQRWRRADSPRSTRAAGGAGDAIGACIALAFPDRVARRRDATGADWLSVGGRGFRLDPASPLARETWLAVAEVGGAASGARILSAAPIDQATVESAVRATGSRRAPRSRFDPATGTVSRHARPPARRDPALGRAGQPRRTGRDRGRPARRRADAWPGAAALERAARALRIRAAFARERGSRHRRSVRRGAARRARRLAARPARRASAGSARSTPAPSPARSRPCSAGRVARRSTASPPRISRRRPAAATRSTMKPRPGRPWRRASRPCSASRPIRSVAGGTVPLVLSLTSPAGRPIQTTRDLPGFWRGQLGARSRRRCAAAIRNTPGPTIPPAPRPRPAPSRDLAETNVPGCYKFSKFGQCSHCLSRVRRFVRSRGARRRMSSTRLKDSPMRKILISGTAALLCAAAFPAAAVPSAGQDTSPNTPDRAPRTAEPRRRRQSPRLRPRGAAEQFPHRATRLPDAGRVGPDAADGRARPGLIIFETDPPSP